MSERQTHGDIIGQVDASKVPRYAGTCTFARLPRLDEVASCDVGIIGLPFDSGTSYRPGARFGPRAIREASRLLRPYNPAARVSPFAIQQVADAGDLGITPFDISRAVSEIENGVSALLDRAPRVLALGGDHTIALPMLRCLKERWGPIAVIHFDAHLDTWDTYFDAPITHGTPFRRAAEEGLLKEGTCIHVGIRGPLYSEHDSSDDAQLGFVVISTEDVATTEPSVLVSRIRERLGDAPVYVSVDIDVLDPAFAPGTGTPEPAGLSTRELLFLLRGLAGTKIVAADLVEVSPAYDHAEITALAAAHICYEVLCSFPLDGERSRRKHSVIS